MIDDLFRNLLSATTATENTRLNSSKNPDLDLLEDDCNRARKDWEKVSNQVRRCL